MYTKKTKSNKPYRIALDIGTINVQGALLKEGVSGALAIFSCLNKQLTHGYDLISRLNFALQKHERTGELKEELVESINEVINGLLGEGGVKRGKIGRIVAVGNSAMNHILLGLPLEPLAKAPFVCHSGRVFYGKAADFGFCVGPDVEFIFLPNIGGFVGSDAIAVILAAGIHKSKTLKLAVDLGTNGEVILGDRNRIYVASAAAGPAFEGLHISCGMMAKADAIDSVKLIGKAVKFHVIGGGRPKGLCGSGLIDAVAALLKLGLLDETGRMTKEEFIIYDKDGIKISITQDDIRQIQLAKGAILSGISLLMRATNAKSEDLGEIIFTGNFGNYLRRESISAVGLVPKGISLKKVKFLRDGALVGAGMAANSDKTLQEVKEIVAKCKHISLAEAKDFQEEFASSMKF